MVVVCLFSDGNWERPGRMDCVKKGSLQTSARSSPDRSEHDGLRRRWVKRQFPCNDGAVRGVEVGVRECQGMGRSLARSHLVRKEEEQVAGERKSVIVDLFTRLNSRLALPQPWGNFGSYLAEIVINERQTK